MSALSGAFNEEQDASSIARWIEHRATDADKRMLDSLASQLSPGRVSTARSGARKAALPVTDIRPASAAPRLAAPQPALCSSLESHVGAPVLGGAAVTGHPPVHASFMTTNQALHGMQDMYPALYAEALPLARPKPAANKNFVSMWGDALKGTSKDAWKANLLTTNQATNRRVHPPDDAVALAKDRSFAKWVSKAKLYYRELFNEGAAARVDEIMSAADVPRQKELLAMFRAMYAVCRPDRRVSVSQHTHKLLTGFTDPETDALMKRENVYRNVGRPRPVKRRPATSPGGRATAATIRPGSPAVGGGPRSTGALKLEINTFNSTVPMKWSTANVGTLRSTYADVHGNTAGQGAQPAAYQPVAITCPYGSIDPVQDVCTITKFPVPEGQLQASIQPFTDPDRNAAETTNRMTCLPRRLEDVARSQLTARYNILQSKQDTARTSVPLGRQGVNFKGKWDSEYSAEFFPQAMNVAENRAASERFKAMLNCPTASVGPVLGRRGNRPCQSARA